VALRNAVDLGPLSQGSTSGSKTGSSRSPAKRGASPSAPALESWKRRSLEHFGEAEPENIAPPHPWPALPPGARGSTAARGGRRTADGVDDGARDNRWRRWAEVLAAAGGGKEGEERAAESRRGGGSRRRGTERAAGAGPRPPERAAGRRQPVAGA
jgi:hypothetical protein